MPSPKFLRPFVRPAFYNCVTLIVIFTLCLYGLGVVGLYLRWFILENQLQDTPTPIIVTVVMPGDEDTDEIIVTVVVTPPPTPDKTATPTLEPTPTQWWPSPTPTPLFEPELPPVGHTPDAAPATTSVIPLATWVLDATPPAPP